MTVSTGKPGRMNSDRVQVGTDYFRSENPEIRPLPRVAPFVDRTHAHAGRESHRIVIDSCLSKAHKSKP